MCRHYSALFYYLLRLDVKAQIIDKGYPRYTDLVFGGVPTDAHDVFLYKGKRKLIRLCCCFVTTRNCARKKKHHRWIILLIFQQISWLIHFKCFIAGHTYFCRGRFYWRMNSRRQVDRVGYVKYDVMKCPHSGYRYWDIRLPLRIDPLRFQFYLWSAGKDQPVGTLVNCRKICQSSIPFERLSGLKMRDYWSWPWVHSWMIQINK